MTVDPVHWTTAPLVSAAPGFVVLLLSSLCLVYFGFLAFSALVRLCSLSAARSSREQAFLLSNVPSERLQSDLFGGRP